VLQEKLQGLSPILEQNIALRVQCAQDDPWYSSQRWIDESLRDRITEIINDEFVGYTNKFSAHFSFLRPNVLGE